MTHEMTFRVEADDPTDVRDLGNALKEAIDKAQKRGLHLAVIVAGPTIRPCPGCTEPCGQCST